MGTGVKIAILAALAALMAIVLTGATSAMAESTALCTKDESPCGSKDLVTHVHETSVGKGVFKSSLPTIECNVLFLGDALEEEGSPLVIHGQFTYTSCNNFCTVKEEIANATIEVLRTASELTAVVFERLVNLKCPFINCNFIGSGLEGHGLGPLTSTSANGSVVFTEQPVEKESGSCPEEEFLVLTTTPLSATYLGEAPPPPGTALCSKDEGSPICKSENQLKSIDYKDKAVEILTNLINVKCEGLVSGTVGEPSNPLEVKPELTYTGCSGGCFVTSVAGPGKIILERTKAEEAKATSEGFEIFVKCGTTIKCLLGPEKVTGSALGALTTGDNGHLTFSKASLGKGEGATCPSEATLDALYIASSAAYIG